MGKKKIILLLFMLSNIHIYSQELHWQSKNELTQSLYQSLENFACEDTCVKSKHPSIFEVNLFEYFNDVLTKKKKEKRYAEQKQMKQQEVKNFLESHFIFYDTIPELVFFDKSQIIEWGQNFGAVSFVQSKEFNVKDRKIFILMVDKCSGVRCLSIYVFEQEGRSWKLMTGTNTDIKEKIIMSVDNEQNKIVFETELRRIGELPLILLKKS